jgi:hypothetical protein
MDLTNTRTVDDVSHSAQGVYVLSAYVTDAWDDSDVQLRYVADKLDAYRAFVQSGEMVMRFPESAGRPVEVWLHGVGPPTPRLTKMLDYAKQGLGRTGITLVTKVLTPEVRRLMTAGPPHLARGIAPQRHGTRPLPALDVVRSRASSSQQPQRLPTFVRASQGRSGQPVVAVRSSIPLLEQCDKTYEGGVSPNERNALGLDFGHEPGGARLEVISVNQWGWRAVT